MSISVQTQDFEPGAETEALSRDKPGIGAIATFVGLVRGSGHKNSISAMTLEHYPGMTEKALADIAHEAHQRWSLDAVRVIHRIGRLETGARIVFVGVASRHRSDAFSACEFIMDALKTRAPFWKCEETSAGRHWVDARESDSTAAARWEKPEKH